jgi:hypothetical protein
MTARCSVMLLLGIALIFGGPARADRIRTGSSYGKIIQPQQSSAIGTQSLVPLRPVSEQDGDLLLQISPTSPDLGDPLKVTLVLSPTELIPGTGTFGILECPGLNLGTVCTPGTNPVCDLSGVSEVSGTITLPGACDVANETFYFDEPAATGQNPFTGAFAQVSPVTPTVPEPGSLALAGVGLLSLAFLSKRRSQA